MVSDIVLVLRSEHRDLVELADQCTRPSRGFEDPAGRLHARLVAHRSAMERIAATTSRWLPRGSGPVADVLEMLRDELDEPADRGQVPRLAQTLVSREEHEVVPMLETSLPILERRRAGRSFRLVRDAVMRGNHPSSRRIRSQAELYALARRAGLEQRSRMTQVELQRAVEAWERSGGVGGD